MVFNLNFSTMNMQWTYGCTHAYNSNEAHNELMHCGVKSHITYCITYRKSSSCLMNSVRFSLFNCTPSSIGCLFNMSSMNMGTFKSGNSSRLFKASFVTENRDDKFDLNKFSVAKLIEIVWKHFCDAFYLNVDPLVNIKNATSERSSWICVTTLPNPVAIETYVKCKCDLFNAQFQ